MYSLVLGLANDGLPVAVTCRVLAGELELEGAVPDPDWQARRRRR